MNLRISATLVFGGIGFILSALASGLISANVRKLADKHGWDNFLVHWTEKLRWERLRALWWLWSIFGLSGGFALALWLSPLLLGDGQVAALHAQLATANRDRVAAQQELEAARQDAKLATAQHNAATARALTPDRPAILDETAHLPANDKERLSDEFYDLDKLFKQANKLLYDAKYQLDPRGAGDVSESIAIIPLTLIHW